MNKYLITGIVATVVWQGLSDQAWTHTPRCISKSLPQVNRFFNSSQQNNVIVIGKFADRPYVVVIPSNSDQLLKFVRRYVADAFLAQHKLGAYVHAGGFTNRGEAECLSSFLRSHGLDARVVYFQ